MMLKPTENNSYRYKYANTGKVRAIEFPGRELQIAILKGRLFSLLAGGTIILLLINKIL